MSISEDLEKLEDLELQKPEVSAGMSKKALKKKMKKKQAFAIPESSDSDPENIEEVETSGAKRSEAATSSAFARISSKDNGSDTNSSSDED